MKHFVEWSDAFSVGVEEIDDQHKQLVHMINELHEGIDGGWGAEAKEKVFVELAEYARVHFATEESLMSISNYPGSKGHKGQHHGLNEIVKEHISQYAQGSANISNYDLLLFLKKWLINHIMEEDKKLGTHLVATTAANLRRKKSLFGWLRRSFGFGD